MDLSIIIPAFNAFKTIDQTLSSIECIINQCSGKLIIVDDGSTDDTIIIIKKWEKKLKDKLIFLQHKENLGGGAARNTGINAAKSTYVLVCDSDDISNLESVKLLYNTAILNENGAAHYQYAHFFRKDPNKIDSIHDYFSIFKSNEIKLTDAILKSDSLLVNFLFKKTNWEKAGKYPEHHGWDTQGFSIRYLLSNPGVNIAENSYYSHRRFFGNFSYYEREFMSGNNYLNSWLTVEDLIGKVPDTWFYNFISNPILSKIDSINLLKNNINNYNFEDNTFYKDNLTLFINGIVQYNENKFEKSIETFSRIQLLYPSEILLYLQVRSLLALNKSIRNPSNEAFEFFRNIGKIEQSLRGNLFMSLFKKLKFIK